MKTAIISAILLTASLAGGAVPSASARIDRVVLSGLGELKIPTSKVCTDAVFVRRVYLDMIGTIPTAAEARAFLADKSSDKRSALIEQLFKRSEFSDYWANKWSDLLRVKAEFPINLWPNAAQAYHHWIRTGIKENKPYDKFVREILTSSGSNFRVPQVNFYRALQSKEPEAFAQTVALTFMGARADKWKKDRLAGMAVMFSQIGFKKTAEWKEEVVYFDSLKAAKNAASGALKKAVFPDGTPAGLTESKDPRVVFANWLTKPTNPWFTRNIVNRAWYWLQGRGIVHEPDDIRATNPASNPKLLVLLQRELIASKYDMKHLFRIILNSKTYQRSAIPASKHPKAEALFAHYPIRRLDAEVLIDALCQITGTTETYSSLIPEPFTFIPEDCRSIALPDGSITSPFLEMFGRPPRDTGLESERNNKPTGAQRLHLLNSSHIRNKIERSKKLQAAMRYTKGKPSQAISTLYLTILSRYPTADEFEIIREYAQSQGAVAKPKAKTGARGKTGPKTKGRYKGTGRPAASGAGLRTGLIDLTWALINSSEFLYRH
ncbi:MAG: DUF1553 domain-containing protein [Phycisphaerae bacterium]|jgi:hypothetical protein|nr:DUF1553 domain-containing protein [Phycisphaerae bacterium]